MSLSQTADRVGVGAVIELRNSRLLILCSVRGKHFCKTLIMKIISFYIVFFICMADLKVIYKGGQTLLSSLYRGETAAGLKSLAQGDTGVSMVKPGLELGSA